MRTLDEYMRMPWSVVTTRQEDEDGVWEEATVTELPGLYASVRDGGNLEAAFYEALAAHIGGMMRDGAEVPIPTGGGWLHIGAENFSAGTAPSQVFQAFR